MSTAAEVEARLTKLENEQKELRAYMIGLSKQLISEKMRAIVVSFSATKAV